MQIAVGVRGRVMMWRTFHSWFTVLLNNYNKSVSLGFFGDAFYKANDDYFLGTWFYRAGKICMTKQKKRKPLHVRLRDQSTQYIVILIWIN